MSEKIYDIATFLIPVAIIIFGIIQYEKRYGKK